MSDIALYNLLKRIPDATDEEIEKAVADFAVSKEVSTKADLANLETRVIEKVATLEAKLTRQMYAVGGVIIIVNTAVIGLMIRFLFL
ncbi:MAG: hypothetical protein GDA45_06975 [Chromatiales bacterium]|nr:hypothetical protein [Chromatiales bacterium]